MRIRLSTLDDKEALLELVSTKHYPSSPPTGVSSEQRGRFMMEDYGSRWLDHHRRNDSKFLMAERRGHLVAFVHLALNQKSGVTGDLQSRILDHHGVVEAYPELLEATLALSRQNANKYLTSKVYLASPAEKNLFQSLGFMPEVTRVVKKVGDEDYRGPFTLRHAQPGDRLFMALRNAENTLFYLYANRPDEADPVATRNFSHYLNLDLSQPDKFMGVVVENGDGPVGYVLLQNYWEMDVTKAPGSYVYDVAVDPRYWGTRAAFQIAHYAHCEVKRYGREYIFGDVSHDNPRTLRWAIRGLGYQADWERWGKPVGAWDYSRPKGRPSSPRLSGKPYNA